MKLHPSDARVISVLILAAAAGTLLFSVAQAVKQGPYADVGQDTFAHACAAAMTASKTLLVTKAWTSLPTQTCAANLQFEGQGRLQPAKGAVVTLSGSVAGPKSQVFDQSLGGTVTLSNPQVTLGDWWGSAGTSVSTADISLSVTSPPYLAKGDGMTDDTIAITNAINSTAKTIVFPDTGSFYFVSAPINIPPSKELVLMGKATIRQTTANDLFRIAWTGDSHDIRIRGGIIEGTYTGGISTIRSPTYALIHSSGIATHENVTLDGVEIRNSLDAGVWFGNSKSNNTIVEKCIIHNNANFGLSPGGTTRITNNAIYSNKYAGIDISTPGVVISHNEIYANGGGNHRPEIDTDAWTGIIVNSASNIIITENSIHDNLAYGVYITTGAVAQPSGVTISKNRIYGHAADRGSRWKPAGVITHGANNLIVTENIASGNYDDYVFQVGERPGAFLNSSGGTVSNNQSISPADNGFVFAYPKSSQTGRPIAASFTGWTLSNNSVTIADTTKAYVLPPVGGSVQQTNNQIIPAIETLGSEMVENPSFETGDPPSNWAALNGATLAQVADPAANCGAYAIRATRTSSSNQEVAISDSFPLVKGKIYRTSYDAKAGATGQALTMAVGYNSAGWNYPSVSVAGRGTSYTRYTTYFTAPYTGAYQVVLWLSGKVGASAECDCISLKEVTSAPYVLTH